MEAELTLILFMLFLNILLTIIAVGILIHNKITVMKKVADENLLIKEMKDYFDKQQIRKPGF